MTHQFPDKRYSIIYADPPWAYKQGGRGAAKNHYHTMTEAEISAIPVESIKAAGGGHCLLHVGDVPQHRRSHSRYGGVGFHI